MLIITIKMRITNFFVIVILVFSLLLTLLSVNAYTQTTNNEESFLDSWLGTYRGQMYMFKPGKGITDSVAVKLELLSTEISNQWVYLMTYTNIAKY